MGCYAMSLFNVIHCAITLYYSGIFVLFFVLFCFVLFCFVLFCFLFLSVPAYRSGYYLIWRGCVQIVNIRKVLTWHHAKLHLQ